MEQNKKADKLLEVRDLQVSFFTPAGEVKAVNGISYDVNYNEVMGVVGESGSGKSVEAYSIIGLLQNPGKVIGGSITFEGQDVLAKTPAEMVNFRGNEVAMIFQNPMTCLNPVYTIDCIFIHGKNQAEKSKRLQILNKSNDGFYIAQEDLKLRGPGDLFGVCQSGDLNFEIADIFRDASILKKASDAAGYILSLDGTLELPQHRLLKEKLEEYVGRQIEDPGL